MSSSQTATPDERYQHERVEHWNRVARDFPDGSRAGRAYHRRIEAIYGLLVRPGLRVIELGCGTGGVLSALRPAYGVGLDLSAEMVELARARYPSLSFVQADVHDRLPVGGRSTS